MSEPFDLDFNNVELPTGAQLAAENVEQKDLVSLFLRLEGANALWNDPTQGQKGAALAALRAIIDFVGGQGYNLGGEFSRPLELLLQEVENAPAPAPGNILAPFTRRQTPEAARRQKINNLKASGAYAARRLSEFNCALKVACNEVAEIFVAHRFPLNDYYAADGSPRVPPGIAAIAARVEDWAVKYPTTQNTPGKIFRNFCAQPPRGLGSFSFLQLEPANARYVITAWLRDELKAGGFNRA